MADKAIDPKMKVGMPGLGARIRDARKAAGYTQDSLAEYLDVSWMSVHRWERDQRPVSYGHLAKLSERCGVDIGVLVPGLIQH